MSAIAVVVGLVFVGLELRQSTAVQRITATQTLTAQYVQALEVMAPRARRKSRNATRSIPAWRRRRAEVRGG